jgi:hypothetical protein
MNVYDTIMGTERVKESGDTRNKSMNKHGKYPLQNDIWGRRRPDIMITVSEGMDNKK